MASLTRREKYNANRRERQSKARQAVFISEYFYVKYFEIYKEAAQFYNEVNTQHPLKHDLRKCEAFRIWKKREQTGQQTITNSHKQTRGRYRKFYYANIPVKQQTEQSERPISSVSSESSTEQSKSPSSSVSSESPTEQSESPNSSVSSESPTEQSESPNSTVSSETPTEQSESPNSTVSSENPNSTERFEIPVYSIDQRSETPNRQKTMRLEIPLTKPSVVTETLHIVTQQEKPLQIAAEGIPQESMTIHPSLTEELPRDIIDHIVEELRADPEMRTVMTNIEEELEFEHLGMEVEIMDDDRLEDELENLMW